MWWNTNFTAAINSRNAIIVSHLEFPQECVLRIFIDLRSILDVLGTIRVPESACESMCLFNSKYFYFYFFLFLFSSLKLPILKDVELILKLWNFEDSRNINHKKIQKYQRDMLFHYFHITSSHLTIVITPWKNRHINYHSHLDLLSVSSKL